MTDYRILIVDDDPMTCRVLTQHLRAMGFVRLTQEVGGEPAADLLAQAYGRGESFDLVLLDWHMAGEGGLKFLAECRRDARFRSLPIIIVTCDSEDRSILLAENKGATSYIVKPVSHDDLKKSVFQALPQSEQKQLQQ